MVRTRADANTFEARENNTEPRTPHFGQVRNTFRQITMCHGRSLATTLLGCLAVTLLAVRR